MIDEPLGGKASLEPVPSACDAQVILADALPAAVVAFDVNFNLVDGEKIERAVSEVVEKLVLFFLEHLIASIVHKIGIAVNKPRRIRQI